jgi:ubiquinone/menaquinone biosynthesis C-methylase UbiE
MEKKVRWRIAQESERKWWEREISAIDFTYFSEFARDLLKSVSGVIAVTEKTRILEIGTGPAGILTYLPSKFRCGIDPLEFFYGRTEKCLRFRDRNVNYLAAQGEFLPYSDDTFDLLIIDNILDHCEDVEAVFKEVKRVLSPRGVVYLRNFTHTLWGVVFAGALEFFRIDRGHPYHFTEKSLRKMCLKNRLEPVLIERRGLIQHFRKLFSSKMLSHRLRALSFSQADKILFILKNMK